MKRSLCGQRGFTLLELLIAIVLVGMVFLGAISIYLSSLNFLGDQQKNDVTTNPVISMETISKRISLSNDAWIGGGQLHLRADYAVNSDFSTSLATPGDTTDDGYWHYAYVGNALRCISDSSPGTVVTATDPLVIPNVDTASSTFQMTDPSSTGTALVVSLSVVTTDPVATLTTNVAVGARARS